MKLDTASSGRAGMRAEPALGWRVVGKAALAELYATQRFNRRADLQRLVLRGRL